MLEVERFPIAGVLRLEPRRFGDERGFFSEVYNQRAFAHATGFEALFVQDNHSYSRDAGTVRGLHFQKPPHAQDKLVRVVRGRILDVAVDIRRGSPTYGQHVAVELSAQNWAQLWVPVGFAHGFMTLEPETEVLYKVTAFYDREADCGIHWRDPSLGIAWPELATPPVLSTKDLHLERLTELVSPF